MIIIPKMYECEICHKQYLTKNRAETCEKQKPVIYPIGMIYGNHYDSGHIYKDMTFAVAEIELYEHLNISSSWACRDGMYYGDSLGKNTCGMNSLNLNEYDSKLNFEHPTFKRMVAYLLKNNIPITIWNGKEPILYKTKS